MTIFVLNLNFITMSNTRKREIRFTVSHETWDILYRLSHPLDGAEPSISLSAMAKDALLWYAANRHLVDEIKKTAPVVNLSSTREVPTSDYPITIPDNPVASSGFVVTDGETKRNRQLMEAEKVTPADVLAAKRSKARGRPYNTDLEKFFHLV